MADGAHVGLVLVVLVLVVHVFHEHPFDTGRGEVMVSPDTISVRAHSAHLIPVLVFTHFLSKVPSSSICNAGIHMGPSHGAAGWPGQGPGG